MGEASDNGLSDNGLDGLLRRSVPSTGAAWSVTAITGAAEPTPQQGSDEGALGMNGAVPAFEVHTTRTGARRRREVALVSPQPGVIEIPREIHPFPLADVAVHSGPVEEVKPADRSERLSRALNIMVALL